MDTSWNHHHHFSRMRPTVRFRWRSLRFGVACYSDLRIHDLPALITHLDPTHTKTGGSAQNAHGFFLSLFDRRFPMVVISAHPFVAGTSLVCFRYGAYMATRECRVVETILFGRRVGVDP